jgi:olefin beta-lactone synthetase
VNINIAQTLTEVADLQGDKIGLVEAATGKELTFKEIDSISDNYATLLIKNGVHAGERVMLMVKPSADFICLTFALFKIGSPVILIDPGMGYKNLLRCIEGVKPKVFIGIPKAHVFRKLFPKPFRSVEKTFCCGFSFGLFGTDISKVKIEKEKGRKIYSPESDDLAAIIFTTGSTGPPKGVRYEHTIFSAQLRMIKEYYKITASDIDQPAFPLFALFSTALGACAVIPDMDPTQPAKVDPKTFIASLNDNKVTYSFGSPALWNVVSAYCIKHKITLTSVKQILMAGAPVSGELIGRVSSILSDEASIHTPYGATESLPIVSIEGREILDTTWPRTCEGKGTCVGRPLPGITVKIIPISDDVIPTMGCTDFLPPGEIGEIIVQGDVVTKAYENNSDETKLAKIEDGKSFWHRMGDTGYVDDIGRIWFCGRRGHRVITEEGTYFTIPCEAIINNHPAVYRSALVGVPSSGSVENQIPVMIVEPMKESDIKEKTLLAEVKRLSKSHPLTERIDHFLLHPDFPVDIRHNAKIFREKLSVWAQSNISIES